MNTTPQPAVDAAKEIMEPLDVWSEEYSLRMIDWFAAIIARHYAPLVALREDQMQALGLPDDDHTVIADEIRRIRDEGRKHFHDVTRLTERVEVLQNLLASAGKYADEFRKERDALRSKYASAEADGNSLREDREKLIARVTELEAERNDARRHWADTQHIAANLKLKVAELEKDRDAQKIRGDCLQREVSLWTKWREEQPWVQEIEGYKKQVAVMHSALFDIRNSAGEQVMVTTGEGHSYCVHAANAALYAASAKEDAT